VSVGPASIATGTEYREGNEQDREACHALRLRDLPLLAALGILGPVAGTGVLYLLREAGVAGAGPSLAGALPLEQLARGDAQPLVRMALAWVPVGLATGGLLAFTRSSRAPAVAVMALVAAVVMLLSAAISDALANNETLGHHLATPLGAAGTWVSLALLVIGAGAGAALGRATARAPSAA